MRALALIIVLLATPALAAPETRCGWWDNPTPANTWLTDADGEWTVGTQGADQAEWAEDATTPGKETFSKSQWVSTNGHYGYGCACVKADFDVKEKRVTYIHRLRAKPLSACNNDAKLAKRDLKSAADD